MSTMERRRWIWRLFAVNVFWLVNHWMLGYRLMGGSQAEGLAEQTRCVVHTFRAYWIVVSRVPLFSIYPQDVFWGVVGAATILLYAYLNENLRGKFRDREEYGSARWSA